MRALLLLSLFFLASRIEAKALEPANDTTHIIVPIGGNTWGTPNREGGIVSNKGIERWNDPGTVFTTFVRVSATGYIRVWLDLKAPDGIGKIQLSISGRGRKIKVNTKSWKRYYVGQWRISDTGYIAFRIKGIEKTGNTFADISNLELRGTAINERTAYTKNNEENFFYWGRRGPSVHLNYLIPDSDKAEWFYNEVTVPKGQDAVGSYCMADGFSEGYFGMQVNSLSERRILFSVWSAFKTDDPKEIPGDQKIQLVKKGELVHAGEFGSEGSGGQSYLNFNWKAGITYKFLLHATPDGKGNTIFTAYFFTPGDGHWHLIASFRRPVTNTWLTHLYSFLENFSPDEGDITRSVLYGNQWIRTNSGQWIELNKIRFTADHTASNGYRMDYAGGVRSNRFYLRNCGFFNHFTQMGTYFERPLVKKHPVIDWNTLP